LLSVARGKVSEGIDFGNFNLTISLNYEIYLFLNVIKRNLLYELIKTK